RPGSFSSTSRSSTEQEPRSRSDPTDIGTGNLRKGSGDLMLTIAAIGLIASGAATAVQTGYAPVNGLKMYYEIHGRTGEPLVLIHGGGSTIESNWARVL